MPRSGETTRPPRNSGLSPTRYNEAVETAGWDGDWYQPRILRRWSPTRLERKRRLQIDSIAQSWSVISHAAIPERAATAMKSLNEHLVREDARLIMLLTPPFNKSQHDPGYIQGYLPGVSENGAQYTHAASGQCLQRHCAAMAIARCICTR